MLQTISNVKRKSKQHIKLARAFGQTTATARTTASGCNRMHSCVRVFVCWCIACCLLQFYGQIAICQTDRICERTNGVYITLYIFHMRTREYINENIVHCAEQNKVKRKEKK